MDKKDTEFVKCKECSEFISINKVGNTGKCLRDSMYKDSESDSCEFGFCKSRRNNFTSN
jgi:hypothetical protein